MNNRNYIHKFLLVFWENRRSLLFSVTMFLVFVGFVEIKNAYSGKIRVELAPDGDNLMTQKIQSAIDSCAKNGGGVVVFSPGTYISGGIQLKNKVTLQLEKGALLQGSENYRDYENDAFIFGKDISDIAITGEGVIDGVDCRNPNGEEGFRGPHCIRLVNCKNISFKDFTVKNSANWAINCRYCSGAKVENVSIRGGHDGLHTRFCEKFTVSGCDFRTGDDAFAGNDNRDFVVTDCKINTSCNGFRMGCQNFTVKNCRLWGPGESVHKIQKRNNMLSAFVHFSPKDENPKLESGNWLIENVTVENVDHFYMYNYQSGLWQTGQPTTGIKLNKVKCSGILSAFNIVGDPKTDFDLSVENSSFAFRNGASYSDSLYFEGVKIQSTALFSASNFGHLSLKNVVLEKQDGAPLMNCSSGSLLVLDDVDFICNNNPNPLSVQHVKEIRKEKLKTSQRVLQN